jgi:hypothetical protein
MINKRIPQFTSGRENSLRADIVRYFEDSFQGFAPYKPPDGSVQKWETFYEESIEFLRNEFFPHIHGQLWPEIRLYEEEISETQGYRCDREESFAELLSSIWNDKQGKIDRLEKKLHSIASRHIRES